MTTGGGLPDSRRRAPIMFGVATVVGTVHAAWSAYWAFGGRLLLETVGAWAVEGVNARPMMAFTVLLGAAIVKILAAWIPLLSELGYLSGRRVWRAVAWLGAPALLAYGLVNVIAAGAILMGWIDADPDDRLGLIGHAMIWDPLFALWGAALTIGLIASRSRSDSAVRTS